MPLRKLSIGVVPQANIECWNEDEMLGQIRMSLLNRIGIEYGLFPKMEKHRMATVTDEQFKEIRRSNLETWPFLNWMRRHKVTEKEAMEEMECYMLALKNAETWQSKWSHYEQIRP